NVVLLATVDPCSLVGCSINGLLAIVLAGIDCLLDTGQRNDSEDRREDVVEAALRQATVDGHLTAFEAVDGYARTGLLTLDTATTGLALAGTDTATYALTVLRGAFVVLDFIKLHDLYSLTSRRRRERGAGRHGSCRGQTGCLPACEPGASC